MIRRVDGKTFYCLPDQSAPDLDVAALEKRLCNALLAHVCAFERGVDAFAGVGISSLYWSKCVRELYLVEQRPAALRLLRKNLPSIQRPDCKMTMISGKAGDFLANADRRGLSFDFVDCDPFGTCYELLPLISRLVPRGVVCITSGEIFQVYRGLNRRFGRPNADRFRGRKAPEWVGESLVPEMLSAFSNAKLIHSYAYPTSVRMIIAIGGFPVSEQIFSKRPRLLGWFDSRRAGYAPQSPAEGSGQIVD
jgi:hypothetical protein